MLQANKSHISNLKLAWNNIVLIEKQTENILLNNLSGEIKSGQLLTIMGPSGAGKSSFLSLVTKTSRYHGNKFLTKGTMTLNNREYSQSQFFSIASYVPQDDLLLQALTVKQTLDFQAKLKLYYQESQQKQKKVIKILKLLNLYQIKDSYVGGKQKKSISGGQRKRVAIGVQLISDPFCLVLDQPTSGLDSSNSLKIINILSQLAIQQNKLIITTIHQPSTLMFQGFDKLMILSKGQQIYYENSSNIVPYMQSLKIKVDYRMNPADFLMLQISAYKQNQNYKTPMTYENFQKFKKQNCKNQKSFIIEDQFSFKLNFKNQKSVPLVEQFEPLLNRTAKRFLRCPSNQGGRLMQLFGFPLFVGLLFYDIIDRLPNPSDAQKMQMFLREFVSFLFIGLLFMISQTVYDTVLFFPQQKQLIMKEVHSSMYSLGVYYISKLMVQMPLTLLSVWISNSIVYWIIGLKNDSQHWLLFLFVASLVAVSGYMIGIIIGALCQNQHYAIQAVPIVMMPLVTYGGQIVNLSLLPWYSSWVQYVTPLRYGYNILVKNQLQTDQLYNLGDNSSIQQLLGLEGDIKQNLIQLVFLAYGFFVLSFAVLYLRKKFN